MMAVKYLAVLCVVLAGVVCDEKYTDKYDNVDYEEVVQNERLFNAYHECLLERGKCTAEGKELKEHIAEALKTDCIKCTDTQKKGTAFVIKHLINNAKDKWDELAKKYDPTGEFRKKYEDRAKAEGIEIPKA